jgi:N-acetyl-1-D-myo-inositol-2-amino-2-deoxy-alpha-D-glucopyranoside deacetylase
MIALIAFGALILLEAAKHLVRNHSRRRRPQVLVTYDDFGGYGHPDHIQAHRVATYARELAAAASFAPELGSPG